MRNGWIQRRIKDVAKTQYGLSVPMNETGTGFKIFRMGEVQHGRLIDTGRMKHADVTEKEFSEYKLYKGDILFNRTNSFELVGKTGLFSLDGDYCFASYLVRLIVDRRIALPEFLNYFMNCDSFQQSIKSKASRSINQANINATILGEEQVYLPRVSEQQRIVAILDEAFAAIATAKANAEKNLQNARALFRSHLQSIFVGCHSGCFDTTVGDQLTLQRGFDITKDQQQHGNVPVVSSGGVKSFHNKAMVKGPGVVIGRKGTLGKAFYLPDDFWPHDTTLWVKEFNGNLPRFVYYFFRSLDVTHLDSGTANPALNRNQLHPLQIYWLPRAAQPSVVAALDELETETERLSSVFDRKAARLIELKQSLLHQAFTGALTSVPEEEIAKVAA